MPGDDNGFREFVDARYMDLLRIAYLLTGSAHEAEDLLQGSLVKVMRRWKRIDDPWPTCGRRWSTSTSACGTDTGVGR
ncbi:sigma factor [Micromonospora sp. NPDC047707]|uniref:sigma factor n=1 Tax=Micromonospora sp. NPDC047707 TaxID=3154498 RepID=UPI0034516C3A